jgi:hypothetical protein
LSWGACQERCGLEFVTASACGLVAARDASGSTAAAAAHKRQQSERSVACFSGGPGSVKRMGAGAGLSRGGCRGTAVGLVPATATARAEDRAAGENFPTGCGDGFVDR